jgi:hypothetical protein
MIDGIYQAREFNLSGLNGISDRTLETHFKLYEGYVKGTNDLNQRIADILADGVVDQDETPAYSELKRRLGFEYNGMVLHEYYFDNMKKDGSGDPPIAIRISIRQQPRVSAAMRSGKQTSLASEKCAVSIGPSVIRIRQTGCCRIIGSHCMKWAMSRVLFQF